MEDIKIDYFYVHPDQEGKLDLYMVEKVQGTVVGPPRIFRWEKGELKEWNYR